MAAAHGGQAIFRSTLPLRGATTFRRLPPSYDRFRSTLPLRGATPFFDIRSMVFVISIHAPLAGSDRNRSIPSLPAGYFDPRSPCGERRRQRPLAGSLPLFRSTLPLRGATCWTIASTQSSLYFDPRSPCGERQRHTFSPTSADAFRSTLPLRGATSATPAYPSRSEYFDPRSPCGERRASCGGRAVSI